MNKNVCIAGVIFFLSLAYVIVHVTYIERLLFNCTAMSIFYIDRKDGYCNVSLYSDLTCSTSIPSICAKQTFDRVLVWVDLSKRHCEFELKKGHFDILSADGLAMYWSLPLAIIILCATMLYLVYLLSKYMSVRAVVDNGEYEIIYTTSQNLASCSICLDDINTNNNVVQCQRCSLAVHESCYTRWNKGCVICDRNIV